MLNVIQARETHPERWFSTLAFLRCFINDTHNSVLVLYCYRISSEDTHLLLRSGKCRRYWCKCKAIPAPGSITHRAFLHYDLVSVCVIPDCSMFSSVKPFEGQQFSALRKQCQQNRTLFEDPIFLPVDQSLFYRGNRIGKVTWKRPKVWRKIANLDANSTLMQIMWVICYIMWICC